MLEFRRDHPSVFRNIQVLIPGAMTYSKDPLACSGTLWVFCSLPQSVCRTNGRARTPWCFMCSCSICDVKASSCSFYAKQAKSFWRYSHVKPYMPLVSYLCTKSQLNPLQPYMQLDNNSRHLQTHAYTHIHMYKYVYMYSFMSCMHNMSIAVCACTCTSIC